VLLDDKNKENRRLVKI